ncbi:hypothetical protein BU23DRAFT_553181 [Bimuria novae-zelandiae CBS 107.79]|uniref:Uncharacterized protein n=1 Tax=Bimuria novae-zelandiae CBS 107.79 TaxID=1447943 RepID=A0A6A5VBG7_9PLEO|nr:hypothetical protein BU23DRAFT_553181 [Bimuria novae-zelandiae CBS 107.79]
MGPAIKGAVSDFSHGLVVYGLANLASSVIGKLMGATSGSRTFRTTYAISVDPLGGISRLDIAFFVYNFSSEGLRKTAQSVVACCIVKSSANITKIDDNTLRVLVNQCFETSELQLRRAIYAELHESIFNSNNPAYKSALQAARVASKDQPEQWATPRKITNGVTPVKS